VEWQVEEDSIVAMIRRCRSGRTLESLKIGLEDGFKGTGGISPSNQSYEETVEVFFTGGGIAGES